MELILATPKQPQLDKFKAAAKEAGADMDEKDFDEVLGKLAKSEPNDKQSEKPEDAPSD